MVDIINPMRALEDISNVTYDENKKSVFFSKDWNDLKACIDSILEIVNGGIEPPPPESSLLTGLLRAYNFNGNSVDSKSGYNGSDNSISYDVAYGKIGQGAHFGGNSGSYIQAPSTNLPLGNSPFSVAVVFKTTGDGMAFYGFGGTNPYGARNAFGVWAGGKLYFSGFGADLNSGVTVNDGTQRSAVVTYDGSTLKLYINGSLVASQSISLVVQSTDLYIGKTSQNSDYYNGDMDMLYFWDRVLTPSEVLEYHELASEL